jgi:hypothetical protein
MSTSDLSGADSSASINALPPYQTTAAASGGGGGRSTGTSSPASSHGRVEQASTLVHRRALRGNSPSSVTAVSTTTAAAAGVGMTRERRKAAARRSSTSASNTAGDDDFASDEDDLPHPTHETSVSKRREEVRKQRIESEQRRRDELRDGYRRLKDVLPVSNQKSSKVSLLDRGEFSFSILHFFSEKANACLPRVFGAFFLGLQFWSVVLTCATLIYSHDAH